MLSNSRCWRNEMQLKKLHIPRVMFRILKKRLLHVKYGFWQLAPFYFQLFIGTRTRGNWKQLKHRTHITTSSAPTEYFPLSFPPLPSLREPKSSNLLKYFDKTPSFQPSTRFQPKWVLSLQFLLVTTVTPLSISVAQFWFLAIALPPWAYLDDRPITKHLGTDYAQNLNVTSGRKKWLLSFLKFLVYHFILCKNSCSSFSHFEHTGEVESSH